MELNVNKLNFTVGPVMMDESIRYIGAQEIPYFRTRDFSKLMLENECIMRKLLKAGDSTRLITLTGSGTAAMEASVMNTLSSKDKVLVVNGGGFGERFSKLCQIHRIPYEELLLEMGHGITEKDLMPYEKKGFTAFVVNRHETSTGVLYNMDLISDFCKRNHCFLVVDAISSFIADPLKMQEWGINVVITGSQKAYALPPGISLVALDEIAIKRVNENVVQSMYFNFQDYLENGERGQTPFTPAVGIIIQLNQRLCGLEKVGIENETKRIADLANDFRNKVKGLPLRIASDSLSNAVTPLYVREEKDAHKIFEYLEEHYGIWVCPNGGEWSKRVFRVGHIGNITIEDNGKLIKALQDMYKKGML